MSPAKIDFKKHNIWLQNYIFTKNKILQKILQKYKCIYVHIISSVYKLLSVLKIYNMYM